MRNKYRLAGQLISTDIHRNASDTTAVIEFLRVDTEVSLQIEIDADTARVLYKKLGEFCK